MNVNEPLINQKGPISQIAPVGITPLGTGPVLFCFSGSAYANLPNVWIGIDLTLDGQVIGTASVFCNEDQSHRALVSLPVLLTVAAGSHMIGLQVSAAYPHTVTDSNDIFMVTLMW